MEKPRNGGTSGAGKKAVSRKREGIHIQEDEKGDRDRQQAEGRVGWEIQAEARKWKSTRERCDKRQIRYETDHSVIRDRSFR